MQAGAFGCLPISKAHLMKRACLGVLVLSLAACSARGPAPVSARGTAFPVNPAKVETARTEAPRPVTPQIAPSTTGFHTVQRGDTLYAIAFANSLDYREVAIWNRLDSADLIMVGQVLRLTPPPGAVETRPLEPASRPVARPLPVALPDAAQPATSATASAPPKITLVSTPQAVLMAYSEANWAQVTGSAPAVAAAVAPAATPAAAPASNTAAPQAAPASPAPAASSPDSPASNTVDTWLWPADGILAGNFGAAGGKGIDIVGTRHASIKAVAPGKVVYSGTGLRGYGKLLIVKHQGEFLSAYAHNEAILVKEGDFVTAGQKIATMGDSDADRVKLHFEIRRYGKPLDPLNYLPERS